MTIRIDSATQISPMKAGTWAKPQVGAERQAPRTDSVEISQEGLRAQEAARFSRLETLPEGGDKDALMAQVQQWRQSHQLEVNWNAAVDPDHSIYAKSYMESLVCQYEGTRQKVETYYAQAHQENLSFANPHNHLVEKYKFSGSPYFRGDMTEAQRDMAFRQEEALLWGGRLALNDPWALAAFGGVPKGEDVEKTARAYAQSVIDGLIAEYKTTNQIQD